MKIDTQQSFIYGSAVFIVLGCLCFILSSLQEDIRAKLRYNGMSRFFIYAGMLIFVVNFLITMVNENKTEYRYEFTTADGEKFEGVECWTPSSLFSTGSVRCKLEDGTVYTNVKTYKRIEIEKED